MERSLESGVSVGRWRESAGQARLHNLELIRVEL